MELQELLEKLDGTEITEINSDQIKGGIDALKLNEIAKKLKVNKSVTCITLRGKNIAGDNIGLLCDNLKNNKFIHTFRLENTSIGHNGIVHIAEMLESNKTITDLMLKNSNIDDEGAKILARTLKCLGTESGLIKRLYLNENNIGDEGAIAIADICSTTNDCLTFIDLSDNRITDNGASAFADRLLKGTSLNARYDSQICYLTKLHLNNNLITDKGIETFLNVLENNYILIELGIMNNHTSENIGKSLDKINKLLSRNLQIRKEFLDIDEFTKIRKIEGSNNEVYEYRRNTDNSKWIIKTNEGNEYGPRIGAIVEVYASEFMQSAVEGYPKSILINDGGGFKVACPYIEDLKEIPNPNKRIRGILENFVMVFWLADQDCKKNRWFKEYDNYIQFLKLDLDNAFLFKDGGVEIIKENFTPKFIIDYLGLDKILSLEDIKVQEIIECVKKISNKLESNVIMDTGKIYREMLMKLGMQIVTNLSDRCRSMQTLPNLLEWTLFKSTQNDSKQPLVEMNFHNEQQKQYKQDRENFSSYSEDEEETKSIGQQLNLQQNQQN